MNGLADVNVFFYKVVHLVGDILLSDIPEFVFAFEIFCRPRQATLSDL